MKYKMIKYWNGLDALTPISMETHFPNSIEEKIPKGYKFKQLVIIGNSAYLLVEQSIAFESSKA